MASISNAASIAASGMRAQAARLAGSAHRVASASTPGPEGERLTLEALPGGGVRARLGADRGAPAPGAQESERAALLSEVDLGSETLVRISAQRAFEANLAVLRTADEMDEARIDLRR